MNKKELKFLQEISNYLKINPFSYAPEILAQIINEKFSNKKIVLYGNGRHSQIILKNLKNPQNIVAIVDDNIGMNLKEFKKSDIKYDFIIPSNHQYAYIMEEKIKSFGLKVLNLYSFDFFEFFPKKEIKLKKNNKPVLVVISPNYQPEQISLNEKFLSKEFDIYKIYLTSNKNLMFKTNYIKEFYIGNSIINLALFLKHNQINKIILRTSPLNYYIFDIVRYFFKKELIASVMDWLIETKKHITTNHKYYLKMEKKILKESDKIIHSNGGKLFEEKILKNFNGDILEYFHYLPKSFFKFIDKKIDDYENIDLCFIGNVPKSINLETITYGLTLEDYNKIDLKTHIYMTIDRLDIYNELKEKKYKNIFFHNPKPLQELIKKISNYHFGLMLYPDDKEMDIFLKNHHSTVLTTKLFAYLFAGLPIIATNDQELLADFIRKYNIGIVIPRDEIYNLKQIIKKYDYKQMKENIKNNIDKWSVEYNYKKLLGFLQK